MDLANVLVGVENRGCHYHRISADERQGDGYPAMINERPSSTSENSVDLNTGAHPKRTS